MPTLSVYHREHSRPPSKSVYLRTAPESGFQAPQTIANDGQTYYPIPYVVGMELGIFAVEKVVEKTTFPVENQGIVCISPIYPCRKKLA
ncbi:MAG: hypothetical protein ACQESV_09950, partial [Thermodesulfobacteriota bacterium]